MNNVFEKLDDVVFSNDDIVLVGTDSDNVTYFSDDMGFVNVDLNKFSLDDDKFDEDDPENFIHVKLMAWSNKCKHLKVCNKNISKELMPVAWHPVRF